MITEQKNINFFRVLLTILIVYSHILNQWIFPNFLDAGFPPHILSLLNKRFNGPIGYLTDCFFIISGFFMFFTFLRPNLTLGKLIWSKVKRLWPALFGAIAFAWILSKFEIVSFNKYANLIMLTFTGRALFECMTNIGVAWYVSSMFWGFIVYYLICQSVGSQKITIISLLVILGYSILMNKAIAPGGIYGEPIVWNNTILYFLIRAISGMGLGYLIANFYQKNNEETFPLLSKKYIATILEILLFYILIKISLVKTSPYSYPLIIFSFSILLYLFIVKKGIFSQFFEKNIFSFLGKYCYCIYLIQEDIFPLCFRYLWSHEHIGVKNYPLTNIIVSIMSVILAGVILHYLIQIFNLLKKKPAN